MGLQLRGVSKRFGATHALREVDLDFRGGQIHALVGENGAGKSTLINSASGVLQHSGGELLCNGDPVAIHDAHRQSERAFTLSIRKARCLAT